MASSYTSLGTELMTTGENAGTWGTTTNTNLQIVEQIAGGYVEQDIAGSADTTTLSVSDGSTGAVLGHRVIKFTGTITGNQIVTIPLDVQQLYVLVNGTSGAYTVQFKYASGSGSSVTFAATDKGTKLVYATADHATNPNLVDTGIASTGDHDLDGNELILDADADTSITADTDDQIDIKIAGADDFQFTANTFTALSGSTIAAQALTATTIGATGVVTANAGVVVDNITIDGTEIDLSSGDLTVDVAGNLILDADGGYVQFKDGGTEHFRIFTDNSGDVNFNSMVSDKDIHFHGNDGGSDVLALALDMSDAGAATLNNGLTLTDGDLTVASGHGINFAATSDVSGMASELFDNYEEGSFTPTFGGSGGNQTVSYGTQLGTYVLVGKIAYVNVSVIASGTPSGGGGDLVIFGIPFTAKAGVQQAGSIAFANNMSFGSDITDGGCNIEGNVAYLNINAQQYSGTSSMGRVPHSGIHNSAPRIVCSIVYEVA